MPPTSPWSTFTFPCAIIASRFRPRAVECGFEQDRFDEMRALLFMKQDSLGLKSWVSYAHDAGVPDTSRFSSCVQRTDEIPRVAAGLRAAEQFGVNATPTILVSGWRLTQRPTVERLEALIGNVLANKPIGEDMAAVRR